MRGRRHAAEVSAVLAPGLMPSIRSRFFFLLLLMTLQAQGKQHRSGSGSAELDPSPCGCSNIPPPGNWTCLEQRDWGKCEADWMVTPDPEGGPSEGYCQTTCGRCDCPGAPELTSERPATIKDGPCVCSDLPVPDSPFTCKEQRDLGKCSAQWMREVADMPDGFCQTTCGFCPCSRPRQALDMDTERASKSGPRKESDGSREKESEADLDLEGDRAQEMGELQDFPEQGSDAAAAPDPGNEGRVNNRPPPSSRVLPLPAPPGREMSDAELEELFTEVENINDYEEPLPPISRKAPKRDGIRGSSRRLQSRADGLRSDRLNHGSQDSLPTWQRLQENARHLNQEWSFMTTWNSVSQSSAPSSFGDEHNETSQSAQSLDSGFDSSNSTNRIGSDQSSSASSTPRGTLGPSSRIHVQPQGPTALTEPCGSTIEDLLNSPIGKSQFTIVSKLISKSGMLEELKSPTLSATLFVPKDSAFHRLPKGIDIDEILHDSSTRVINFIRKVFLLSMVDGVYTTNDFEDGITLTSFYALAVNSQGGPDQETGVLKMRFGENKQAWFVESGKRAARIDLPDVDLCGSVVHVVDKVLLPPEDPFTTFIPHGEDNGTCDTIIGLLEGPVGGGQFSIIMELIERTGLIEELRNPALSATIFVPTDVAFRSMPKRFCIDRLLKESSPRSLHEIQKLLLFHVVPRPLLESELTDGLHVGTFLSSLGLGASEGDLRFQKSRRNATKILAANSKATIIDSDIGVCKSMVHFIDTVLIPEFDENVVELLTCRTGDSRRPPGSRFPGGLDTARDRRAGEDRRSTPEPPVQAAAEKPIFGIDFNKVVAAHIGR